MIINHLVLTKLCACTFVMKTATGKIYVPRSEAFSKSKSTRNGELQNKLVKLIRSCASVKAMHLLLIV